MVSHSFYESSFVADYRAVVVEAPPGGVKVHRFGSTRPDARSFCIHVVGRTGHEWWGIFAGEEVWDGALTGIAHLPDPGSLLAIVEGTVFVVDAESSREVPVTGVQEPLTGVLAARDHGLLLVSSPFNVHAFGIEGLAWGTARLAIEGIELQEVRGDRVYGTADVDHRPNDSAIWVDLRTGQASGGLAGDPW